MIIVAWLFTAKMTMDECTRWVQFEPYSLVVVTFFCEFAPSPVILLSIGLTRPTISGDSILAIRTYALYGKNAVLGIFLAAVVATELSIQSWAAAGGGPAPIAALGIEGCIWSSTLTKMNAFFAGPFLLIIRHPGSAR